MRRFQYFSGLMAGTALLIAGCSDTPSRAAVTPEQCVTAFSFQLLAPYVVPGQPGDGITYRLMERLNRMRPGGRCYTLVLLPPSEMSERLRRREDGLILWANAVRGRLLRADLQATEPLFWDSTLVVSRKDRPIEYQSLADLYGKTVATPAMFYLRGFDEAAAAGQLQVVPGTQPEGLRRLLAGEVDAAIVVNSMFRHISRDLPVDRYYVARTPQETFSRRILYPPSLAELAGPLNAMIRALKQDPSWVQEFTRFDMEGLFSPQYLDLDQLIELDVKPDNTPPEP